MWKTYFINYLLVRNCAFQAINHNVKSISPITYSHNLFSICCEDTEGFEANKTDQKEKIEKTFFYLLITLSILKDEISEE